MTRPRQTVIDQSGSQVRLAIHLRTFSDFDKLDDSAKAEFIADMVYSAPQALNADGSPELALKMGELFTKIERGEHISKGMRRYIGFLGGSRHHTTNGRAACSVYRH